MSSPGTSPARGGAEQLQLAGVTHLDHLYVKSPSKEAHTKAVLQSLTADSLVDLYSRFPIEAAAQHLGVGLTVLKKRCRQLGVKRWPHRQVKSIQRVVADSLHTSSLEPHAIENLCVMEQQLLANPNLKMPAWVLKQRQVAYKAAHNEKKKCAGAGAYGSTEGLHGTDCM